MKLSVVVPVFNEGELVRAARAAIADALATGLPHIEFEILFVDDGSRDDTFEHLAALAAEFPYVRAIRFAQNCGSHMAIRAGMEHARGDAAAFLACDLQDPPELIPTMLTALSGPVQIVWAVRQNRDDSRFDRIFSRAFYGLGRALISPNLAATGSSMFLLGPHALHALRLHRERNLVLDAALATMNFAQAQVPYERKARQAGKSKWTLGKKLKLFADFFAGYSYAPIRLMSYLGMLTAAAGFVYALVVLINKLVFKTPVEGWTSLMLVLLVVGGMQMVMLGIIGEYMWRTLDEARRRPRYIISATLNDAAPARLPETADHAP
jgi:dolichol-phosphate mannosyltransferase